MVVFQPAYSLLKKDASNMAERQANWRDKAWINNGYNFVENKRQKDLVSA